MANVYLTTLRIYEENLNQIDCINMWTRRQVEESQEAKRIAALKASRQWQSIEEEENDDEDDDKIDD